MKKTIVLCVLLMLTMTIMSALTVSQLIATQKYEVQKCDSTGYHKVITDYGTESLSCQYLQGLTNDFKATAKTDMRLVSAEKREESDGHIYWIVICSGQGSGCNQAKADVYNITHNPAFF